MRFTFIIPLFLLSTLLYAQKSTSPIGFIENKGQIVNQEGKQNEKVLYLLNTPGLNVQLRNNGFSYDIYETKKIPVRHNQKHFGNDTKNKEYDLAYQFHRIDIDFENSNSETKLIATGKSSHFDNYYINPNSVNGVTNVYRYQKVTYKNIYENIDVEFFIPSDSTKTVEYNFIIRPGGKISDIQMKFNGGKTELTDNKIKMSVRFGQMEETLPLSWVEQGNIKKEVAVTYKKVGKNVYGFEGEVNTSDKTIVIDPVPIRLWGTYLGGNGDDEYSSNIVSDNQNNIYVCGMTSSTSAIATSGVFQTNPDLPFRYETSFVCKFDTNGNKIWGTYVSCYSIAINVDSNGNVYGTGDTLYNFNFATPGSHQSVKSDYYDAILIKLSSSGQRVWSTYFGSEGNEKGYSIAFDSQQNVYVGGETTSHTNIITPGAHQTGNASANGYYDAFLAKFNPSGTRLWATYYGGQGSETFFYVGVSNDNNLYCAGTRNSTTNIATPGAYQSSSSMPFGGMLVKFDLNGNRIWGTFLCDDSAITTASLKNNEIVVTGITRNTSGISTPNTFNTNFIADPDWTHTQYSNYCVKFDVNTQNIVWGTYFPAVIISTDQNNNGETYLSGRTYQDDADISTPDGYMPVKPPYGKSYMIKLNNLGQRVWGTYYGSNLREESGSLCLDSANNIYLFGITTGTSGIATPGAYQESKNSEQDMYIAKFKDCFLNPLISYNSPLCAGQNLQLSASGGSSYSWTGPNGFTSTGQNPVITNINGSHSGQYTCTITGSGGCYKDMNITVTIQDTPIPTGNVNQIFCRAENATLNNITISGTAIKWYADATSTQSLAITTLLAHNTTYYATQTINECESVNRLAVTITLINTLNAQNHQVDFCDSQDNGSEIIDLASYNQNLIASTTGNTFSYYKSLSGAQNQVAVEKINNLSTYPLRLGTETVYVRIDNVNTCHQIVTLQLALFGNPKIPIQDIMPICEGSSITVDAGSGNDTYNWSTGATTQQIAITAPGNYSVSVTQNHNSVNCSTSKSFTVVNSNIATIENIVVSEWTTANNTITVLLTSNSQGDYVYSLDGVNYQSGNTFENLPSGQYTVYVKDKNGCGITDKDVLLLMYPKFFTPNGDGYNDYWQIDNSTAKANFKILIFDRLGKLIKNIDSHSGGWDGTFNGQPLPSTDYWFTFTMSDGKEYKGHFALKR